MGNGEWVTKNLKLLDCLPITRYQLTITYDELPATLVIYQYNI